MTWETFDAEWDEEAGHDDPDLPYIAAYTRDDGIRLELYTWESVHVIEITDNATHDVITKVTFVGHAGRGRLLPAEDWDSNAYFAQRPSVAVAALRYAERTWLADESAA